jgi:hypothetical protein
VDLLVVLPVAVVVALLTLVLCDLAGGIARAKGRSYWLFFAFGLLLWFPALITALLLPAKAQVAQVAPPRRLERVLAAVLVGLGAIAAGAGLVTAVAFAP